jgi:signal transduction histidine kinase
MTETSPDCALARSPEFAGEGELTFRGLMHDLGHQMMTLSLLADSVRDDSALSADSRHRMELVMQEMFRIVDVIADSIVPGAGPPVPAAIDLRELAGDVAQLAGLTYDTTVTVEPGRPALIRIGSTQLWRVLVNLVDNAARAAGPGGKVTIGIEQGRDTIIEVTDNGQGFGGGPAGAAGLGLTVVRQLLDAVGGRLEVTNAPGRGTCMRVILGLEREPRLASAGTAPLP